MSYMWKEFNIKTIPAETIVFRNGEFHPELSTLENMNFDKKYDKPIHIIYVGEIDGEKELKIDLPIDNQKLFFSINIKNKKPAFLKIFIKNTGKNSEVLGHVLLENYDNLKFECSANHKKSDTTILVKTKLIAHKKSISKLSGTAIIEKDCINSKSDISFSALAEKDARIEFSPIQRISAIPESAEHSSSLFKMNDFQIEYLRESGLSTTEIEKVKEEAFTNDFSLF